MPNIFIPHMDTLNSSIKLDPPNKQMLEWHKSTELISALLNRGLLGKSRNEVLTYCRNELFILSQAYFCQARKTLFYSRINEVNLGKPIPEIDELFKLFENHESDWFVCQNIPFIAAAYTKIVIDIYRVLGGNINEIAPDVYKSLLQIAVSTDILSQKKLEDILVTRDKATLQVCLKPVRANLSNPGTIQITLDLFNTTKNNQQVFQNISHFNAFVSGELRTDDSRYQKGYNYLDQYNNFISQLFKNDFLFKNIFEQNGAQYLSGLKKKLLELPHLYFAYNFVINNFMLRVRPDHLQNVPVIKNSHHLGALKPVIFASQNELDDFIYYYNYQSIFTTFKKNLSKSQFLKNMFEEYPHIYIAFDYLAARFVLRVTQNFYF